MPADFSLCADCLARYRAIRTDPGARLVPCLIPFASIIWTDEHQPFRTGALDDHETCKQSLIRLTTARKRLWRTGNLAAADLSLWQEAKALLPDWPGFQRLALTPEQLRQLDACEQEADELIDGLRTGSSVFSIEDKGDGVTRFIAHPRPPPVG